MKILYVEDDLAANIESILELFGKLLPKDVSQQLQSAEDDRDGYGASNEEIHEIMQKCDTVDVAYTFPMAMRIMLSDELDRYGLFIVDRNLTDGAGIWSEEEMRTIYPGYSAARFLPYLEREGDFILHYLADQTGVDVAKQFYFLTANSSAEEVRNAADLANVMDWRGFKEENFIPKADMAARQRLREIIDGLQDIAVRAQYAAYFQAVTHLAPGLESDLLAVLKQGFACPSRKRRDRLVAMRNIAEGIVKTVASVRNPTGGACSHSDRLWQLKERGSVTGVDYSIGLAVYRIASEGGAHPDWQSTASAYATAFHGLCYLLERGPCLMKA